MKVFSNKPDRWQFKYFIRFIDSGPVVGKNSMKPYPRSLHPAHPPAIPAHHYHIFAGRQPFQIERDF